MVISFIDETKNKYLCSKNCFSYSSFYLTDCNDIVFEESERHVMEKLAYEQVKLQLFLYIEKDEDCTCYIDFSSVYYNKLKEYILTFANVQIQ